MYIQEYHNEAWKQNCAQTYTRLIQDPYRQTCYVCMWVKELNIAWKAAHSFTADSYCPSPQISEAVKR